MVDFLLGFVGSPFFWILVGIYAASWLFTKYSDSKENGNGSIENAFNKYENTYKKLLKACELFTKAPQQKIHTINIVELNKSLIEDFRKYYTEVAKQHDAKTGRRLSDSAYRRLGYQDRMSRQAKNSKNKLEIENKFRQLGFKGDPWKEINFIDALYEDMPSEFHKSSSEKDQFVADMLDDADSYSGEPTPQTRRPSPQPKVPFSVTGDSDDKESIVARRRPSSQAKTSVEPTSQPARYCTQCGGGLPEGANFCGACGKAVS